jgi:hypothetical protein
MNKKIKNSTLLFWSLGDPKIQLLSELVPPARDPTFQWTIVPPGTNFQQTIWQPRAAECTKVRSFILLKNGQLFE